MELKLDLHVHSYHSPDGRMELDEIVTRCRAAGLDGCAVCDHDACLPPEEIRRIREAYPAFLLIPGTEVSTDLGHLLGWFVTEPVESRDLRGAAEAIHAQGGIAVLAHPFEHTADPSRPVPAAGYIDGVEVWNSRADRKNRKANAMAEDFSRAYGLRRFAGSDAHVPREIGNAVTALTVDTVGGGLPDLDTLKAALLCGEILPSGKRGLAVDAARSQFTRLLCRHLSVIKSRHPSSLCKRKPSRCFASASTFVVQQWL